MISAGAETAAGISINPPSRLLAFSHLGSAFEGSTDMRLFSGQLRGNGLTARCHVWRDVDGAEHIQDVTRLLPDGDYELLVNGLTRKVRLTNGNWQRTDQD